MTRYFYTLLHLSYPPGSERVPIDQDQPVTHAQPYYRADDIPAKENVQMKKKLVLTVLIVLATLTLAACAPSVTSLTPEEGAAYAAEVDEYVENMLVGTSECNFDMTHRGFNPEWKGKIDENTWQQECEAELVVRGAYQSKTLDHVEVRPGIRARVVIYHAVFANNPDVTVTFYFSDDPNHLIIGMDWEE